MFQQQSLPLNNKNDNDGDQTNSIELLLKNYIGIDNFKQGWNPPIKYKEKSSLEYANDLIEFINKYSYLYSVRSLDFYRNGIWGNDGDDDDDEGEEDSGLIPNEWKKPLLEMTDNECAEFHNGIINKDEWPLSLKNFINDAVGLWMPKEVYLSDDKWKLQDEKDFQLDSLFLGMSEKKIHEILRMSEFVNMIAKKLNPKEIVDIGAGEAYLTQILNHQFNHSMTAIDCSESFIEGAIKRQSLIENQRIKKELKNNNNTITTTTSTTNTITTENKEEFLKEIKLKKEIEKKEMMNQLNLKSTNMCVTTISSEMKDDDFLNILKQHDSSKDYSSLMLIGLHTCGILPPTMIKNYLECSNIDSIIDVGCCYYKIDTNSNHEFMSNHCLEKNLILGPAPLKLSCEASDSSQKDLSSYQYSNRIHYYRVILEEWLLSQLGDQNGHQFTIRNLSKNQCKDFESYCNAALKRMKRQQIEQSIHLDFKLPDTIDPIITFYKMNGYYNNPKKEKQISIFLLLRSLLAPVLESLIVLDRFIYLDQFSNNCKSFIIPIFNKKISPRNLVILSFKK